MDVFELEGAGLIVGGESSKLKSDASPNADVGATFTTLDTRPTGPGEELSPDSNAAGAVAGASWPALDSVATAALELLVIRWMAIGTTNVIGSELIPFAMTTN